MASNNNANDTGQRGPRAAIGNYGMIARAGQNKREAPTTTTYEQITLATAEPVEYNDQNHMAFNRAFHDGLGLEHDSIAVMIVPHPQAQDYLTFGLADDFGLKADQDGSEERRKVDELVRNGLVLGGQEYQDENPQE